MNIPTVLVLPLPAQGHVNPLMTFSLKLVEQGCNIIFVNSEFTHEKVVSSMDKKQNLNDLPIKFVSIPDGLPPEDDRNDSAKLFPSILRTMPSMLEKLIQEITVNGDVKVSCIVADFAMGWALEVSSKLGIKTAVFWPASAAMHLMAHNIPKLIDEGIINSDGFPVTRKTFQLSPSIPEMDTSHLWWSNVPDAVIGKKVFNYVMHCIKNRELPEWWLCNSAFELEPGALSFDPKLLPIGPLLRSSDSTSESARSMGQFWEEDLSCLSWLDKQPHQSVVYIAFGSLTLFNQNQFTELALGLQLTNRPFLLVVRQDFICNNKISYPNEFKGDRGKIVGWAPQQKVLRHPSVACFVSHCGWNSCLEGLSNGVPFLCWPYFSDQFFDKWFICDQLGVGLEFELDENKLVSREEIKAKVDQLLNDENIRSKSNELKGKLRKSIEKGGRSLENLNKFVNWLKE